MQDIIPYIKSICIKIKANDFLEFFLNISIVR